jgi:CheY-like chemotaxis protein
MAVVLVVDDEVGIANLLSDVLLDEGHRVLVAANGHEALKRPEEERPDLVITDFMMPVMDGGQLMKAMADQPDLKDVPVFLMSSAPEAAIRDKCSGYALFIRKPFEIYDVIDLVARVVSPAWTASCEPKK